MKRLAVLIVVVVGAVAGTLLVKDPGYVLIRAGAAFVETSVAFAISLTLLVMILVYFSRSLAKSSLHGIRKFLGWRMTSKQRTQISNYQGAVSAIAQGRWREANNLIAKVSAEQTELPSVALLAAWTCHQQGDAVGRDRALAQSHCAMQNPADEEAGKDLAQLTLATWQVESGEYQEALTILQHHGLNKSAHGVALQAYCCFQLKRWQEFMSLWPQVEKSHGFDLPQLTAHASSLRCAWFARASDPVQAVSRAAKALHTDAALLKDLVGGLRELGKPREALQVAEFGLGKAWDSDLAAAFLEPGGVDLISMQSERATKWLKQRPNDVLLLLASAKLAFANGQVPVAKEYLQRGLSLCDSTSANTRELYQELGRVCVALGDAQTGAQHLLRSVSREIRQAGAIDASN